MSSIHRISSHLKEQAAIMATEVVDEVLKRQNLSLPSWEKEQAIKMYNNLLGFYAHALLEEGAEEVPDSLLQWSKQNAAMQKVSGGRISEIMVRYPITRDIFIERLTDLSIKYGLTVRENAYLLKRINSMLDHSLTETIFVFERLTDEQLKKTKEEVAQLSAPIIPVQESVVVLPLVGDIDHFRARYIMEYAVPKIAELSVTHVIADFSGILKIDRQVAEYLHQIGDMVRLMGIKVITTGVRPELAQTIVASSIDLSEITTYATVKQALESI